MRVESHLSAMRVCVMKPVTHFKNTCYMYYFKVLARVRVQLYGSIKIYGLAWMARAMARAGRNHGRDRSAHSKDLQGTQRDAKKKNATKILNLVRTSTSATQFSYVPVPQRPRAKFGKIFISKVPSCVPVGWLEFYGTGSTLICFLKKV